MKKLLHFIIILFGLSASAQVGIGIPSSNIHASAQLDVVSTTKGFLAPRMTEAQKNDINNPAAGLLVYQTDGANGFYYFDGLIWKSGLGPQGVPGVPGPQGERGIDGINGNPGPQGQMGPQGVAGIDGEPGAPGPIGLQGEMGLQGIEGVPGAPGPQGLQGEMGPQGIAGMNGTDGINGLDGPEGPIGDVGPKGDMGEQGPQGVTGMDGATGPMGPVGDVGPKGDTGEQGPQGEMGPQGPSGTPADLSGYATSSDLSSLESQMNNQYYNLQDQIYNNYYNYYQFYELEYQINNVREDVIDNQAQTQTALATKEDSINKSNDVNLGTSETLFPTQNATKTYIDVKMTNLQNDMNNQYDYLQNQIYNNYYNDYQFYWLENQINNVREDVMNNQAQTQTALATKEDSINKSNDVNLGTSDTLFPTQNATKTYVDAKFAEMQVVQGPQGEMGPQGEQGMIGIQGEMGLQGPQGEIGIQGVAGVDGATGPMGPIGDVGAKGDTGEQGPQGPQGEMGPQGPSGTPADLSGYATTSDLSSLESQMNNQYYNLQDQIYNNYYNDSQFHWLEYQIYNVREDVMNNQAQTETALATKEDSINKSNDVNLGTSETLFPTQNATKTYVDAQIATISTNTVSVNEAADEFAAATGQTSFTLTQTPATTSKVKMYINGIRISNAAYGVSETTLTYDPAGNGNYLITYSDRVQFDYSY